MRRTLIPVLNLKTRIETILASEKAPRSLPFFISKRWLCKKCYHERQRSCQPENSSRAFLTRIGWLKHPQKRHLSNDSKDGPSNPQRYLPSQEEGRRSNLSKRFSHLMDHMQSNIFIAGQRLNDLTGYSGIEALKKDIEQQG